MPLTSSKANVQALPASTSIPCLIEAPLQRAKAQDACSADFRSKIQDEARAWFLQRRSNELMTHEELQEFWVILEKSATKTAELDYDDFIRISKLIQDEKAKRYFTARTFARLSKGKLSISAVSLFNFIVRKEWFTQTKIALSLYDVSGQGYLSEHHLESYILDLIPSLTQLSEFEPGFHPFYVCIAVRKFFFFLDPYRTGKLKIMDVLGSGFLDNILELREDDVDPSQSELNWFSAMNAQKLYDQYVTMDEDQNGMLSKSELKKFGETKPTFTDAFIDRFFEENITYDKEIDFKCFVDLVLAIQNKKEAPAVHYFFRILDANRTGYLDHFTLYFFFKDIIQMQRQNGQDVLEFNDICTEIFDIVKPLDAQRITCSDLVNCSQADVIITLLTDFSGFNEYETRDAPVADAPQEQEQEETDSLVV